MKDLKPHPQAEILRAIADGKTVQMSNEDCEWVDAGLKDLVNYPTDAFRIKPETVNINGHEVDPPVQEPLQKGQEYSWLICTTSRLYLRMSGLGVV